MRDAWGQVGGKGAGHTGGGRWRLALFSPRIRPHSQFRGERGEGCASAAELQLCTQLFLKPLLALPLGTPQGHLDPKGTWIRGSTLSCPPPGTLRAQAAGTAARQRHLVGGVAPPALGVAGQAGTRCGRAVSTAGDLALGNAGIPARL